MRIPRALGTAHLLVAWAMPWRSAFRVRAASRKLSFYAHPRDLIGRHIFKYGVHEPVLTRWIASYLAATPKRGLFVDVGANLGWHAVHAAQHPAVETVVAFEPNPFNLWLLDRNLEINGVENCIAIASAVGERRGLVRFHNYKSSNRGRHSVIKDHGYGSRLVTMIDLDSALETCGLGEHRVLVLKIDVEGAEPAVIAGGSRTLARTDAVVMEYSSDIELPEGMSTTAMADCMWQAGFSPHRIEAGGGMEEITLEFLRGYTGQMDVIWIRR